MNIEEAKKQLEIENNTIAHLKVLGASDEQVKGHIERRDYYYEVIQQFEEVGK